MKLVLKKGSTDVTVYVFIQDSSATDGSGLTGLAWNTADLTCYYVRPLAASAQLALANVAVAGAHTDGGFVEVDATNMEGLYRLDLSDAVCAAGVGSVVVLLQGSTNTAPVVLEIQLTDVDLNDGVRGAMTALPNAVADAAGGLPISDAGGLDLDSMKTDLGNIETDTGEIGTAGAGLTDLGGMGTGMKAEVEAEVDDSLASYDPPTKAEMDTAVGTAQTGDSYARIGANGAGLSAVPWNGSWDAEVQSECADALTAYDPPTKAEMDTGHAALNDPTAATVADAVWDEAKSGHTAGGSFGEEVQAHALTSEVSAVETDTQDIQSRLPAALVTGRMSSDAVAISGSAGAADNIEANIGNLDAAVSGRATPAQVNTQVVDVIRTDTATELSSIPAASPSLHAMVQFLFMALRNKIDITASAKEVHDNAGSVIATKSLSDDGTTYTEAKGT